MAIEAGVRTPPVEHALMAAVDTGSFVVFEAAERVADDVAAEACWRMHPSAHFRSLTDAF
jgi:hypothetical protein